jgi:hypothetical protein
MNWECLWIKEAWPKSRCHDICLKWVRKTTRNSVSKIGAVVDGSSWIRVCSVFFIIIISGVGLLALQPLLAYCTNPPAPDDRWWWLWRNWWNEDWLGKPKYSEKTCPSATLSTTNPTWLDPGLNTGRRGGKPATNRLSYGAASLQCYGFS